MHSAWEIIDILDSIFLYFSPLDLAHLAQTCTTLFGPSTDSLWRILRSTTPFLSLLPSDYRTRPLLPEDLERFAVYLPKISKLGMESKNSEQKVLSLPPTFCDEWKDPERKLGKSWKELWEEVRGIQCLGSLLVNLRIVRVSNAVDELLIPLVGITGENLTQIYIKFQHRRAREIFRKLLEQLGDTPKLEYICFQDGMGILPSRLIAQSPLKNLRLELRIQRKYNGVYVGELTSELCPLQPAILRKTGLERLTVGLTSRWSTDESEGLRKTKYLSGLKMLWLDLSTFECTEESGWVCDEECKKPPTLFLDGLDNPSLELLSVKFPLEMSGKTFHDFLSTAKRNCNLQTLTELSLTTRKWVFFWPDDNEDPQPPPIIQQPELWRGLKSLLPLPNLTSLRLTIAPNLLAILDLDLYNSLAKSLPSLRKLILGSKDWSVSTRAVPISHLAAFCSLFPHLLEVGVGILNRGALEKEPRSEWASFGVRILRVGYWVGDEGVMNALVERSLEVYFPNSEAAGGR